MRVATEDGRTYRTCIFPSKKSRFDMPTIINMSRMLVVWCVCDGMYFLEDKYAMPMLS